MPRFSKPTKYIWLETGAVITHLECMCPMYVAVDSGPLECVPSGRTRWHCKQCVHTYMGSGYGIGCYCLHDTPVWESTPMDRPKTQLEHANLGYE